MNKKRIGLGVYSLWVSYGAMRAMEEKNFEDQKQMIVVKEKDILYVDKYVDRGMTCLSGMFVYANPLIIPFVMYRELYRLEINLRGLDELKKNSNYYRLI